MLIDVVADTLLDSVKLLPFLYITYLLIELIEHRSGEAGRNRIGAAGKTGPVWEPYLESSHSAVFRRPHQVCMREK